MSSILSHDRWKILFSQKISTFPTSDREQHVFVFSLTSKITTFESTFDNWEVMSSILIHGRMKKSNFLKRSQLFRHQTEGKMCSSPLLPPRLRPSKAPLPIGRSWVQFLVMTEWKNPIFSEDFIFSDLRTRCNKVYSGPGLVDHLRRPPCSLGGETGIPRLFHG